MADWLHDNSRSIIADNRAQMKSLLNTAYRRTTAKSHGIEVTLDWGDETGDLDYEMKRSTMWDYMKIAETGRMDYVADEC